MTIAGMVAWQRAHCPHPGHMRGCWNHPASRLCGGGPGRGLADTDQDGILAQPFAVSVILGWCHCYEPVTQSMMRT